MEKILTDYPSKDADFLKWLESNHWEEIKKGVLGWRGIYWNRLYVEPITNIFDLYKKYKNEKNIRRIYSI